MGTGGTFGFEVPQGGFTASGDPFGDYARRAAQAGGEPFVQSNRATSNLFDEQIKRGFGAAPESAATTRPTTANIPPATGAEDAAIRRQLLAERAKQMGIGTQGGVATPRPAVSGPGIGAEAGKVAAKGLGARMLGLATGIVPAAVGAVVMSDDTPFPKIKGKIESGLGALGEMMPDFLTGRATPPPSGVAGAPRTQFAPLPADVRGRGADIMPVTQAELDMGERNYQTAMKAAEPPAAPAPAAPVMPTFGGNFADVPKFLAELGAYGAAIGDKRTAAKTARAVDLKTIEAEGKLAETRAKAAAEAKPFTVKGLTGETVVQGNKAYSLDEKGALVVRKVPATAQALRPGLDPALVRKEAEAAVKQGNISKVAINQALKDNGYNFQVK